MKNELYNLLDKIYELEGLVHLSLKREDSLDDFLRLISKKGKEVGELCVSLNGNENYSEILSSQKKFSCEEYSIEDDKTNSDINSSITPFSYTLEENDEKENQLPLGFDKKDKIELQEDSSGKGKLVFSINERFRFRKELFNDSDVDFNNTLALVASMESYEEAEDYFINEEGLDSNNRIVKEFLDVIKRYFK